MILFCNKISGARALHCTDKRRLDLDGTAAAAYNYPPNPHTHTLPSSSASLLGDRGVGGVVHVVGGGRRRPDHGELAPRYSHLLQASPRRATSSSPTPASRGPCSKVEADIVVLAAALRARRPTRWR